MVRLGKKNKEVVANSGDLDGTSVYYWNGWQLIETRDAERDQGESVKGNLELQVYHGTRYIDEVIGLRIADRGRVYLHQDANYNVTAMTDFTARTLERYYYSPYGQLEAAVDAHPFDYDYEDDGDMDNADIAAATSGGDCWGDYDGECWGDYDGSDGDRRRLDADADRDIDAADYTILSAYLATLSTDTEIQRIPTATPSRLGNPFAYQGLPLDAEIGSYQNRHRQYAPLAKRFMQRDPLTSSVPAGTGYRDGLNLYTSLRGSPLVRRDPMGYTADGFSQYHQTCYIYGDPSDYQTCMIICLDSLIPGPQPPLSGVPYCRRMACLWKNRRSIPNSANAAVQQWINDNNETDSCRKDAMQHCVGGAMAANKCGSRCATAGGWALEILQLDLSGQDLKNNKAGAYGCGGSNDPVACCEQLLDWGMLETEGDCE